MKEILTAFFIRKRYAITFFLFVVIGAMTLAYVLPPEYEAAGKIIVTAGREKKPFIPTDKGSSTSFMQVSMEDVGSEVEIILSHSVLAAVVDENHLDEDHPPAPSEFGKYIVYHTRKGIKGFLLAIGMISYVPPRDQAILDLAEKLEVEFVKRTNIVTIFYRSSVPAVASNVVNSLIDNYIRHRTNVLGYSRELDTVRKARDESHTRLTKMEKTLSDYIAAHSISNLESERTLILEKLADAENKMHLLNTLKAMKIDSADLSSPEIANIVDHPAFQELSTKLTDAELKHVELLSRYGQNDRKVRISEQEIGEIRNLIGRMFENSLSTATSIANHYRARLRDLDMSKLEIDPMKREVENITQDYLLNVQKYSELATSVNLDQANFSSVRVVNYADAPRAQAFPKKIIIFVISVFFGAIGGVCLAFAVNRFSGRVLSTAELQSLGVAPVLGMIPEYRKAEMKNSHLLSDNLRNDLVRVFQMLLDENADGPAVVLLSSLSQNSGTSFIARHLAETIHHKAGAATVLISFAYRSSVTGPEGTFAEVAAAPESIRTLVRPGDGLAHLELGVSPDTSVVKAEQIGAFLSSLTEKFRYVILDMPAQRDSMFYVNFVRRVTHLFIVVGYDRANAVQLRDMADRIRQHKGRVSGFLLNRHRKPVPGFIYRQFF